MDIFLGMFMTGFVFPEVLYSIISLQTFSEAPLSIDPET